MDDFVILRDKILAILPNATFGEDNDGQIVIYTNLRLINEDATEDMDATTSA